jgi:hypothetical protein
MTNRGQRTFPQCVPHRTTTIETNKMHKGLLPYKTVAVAPVRPARAGEAPVHARGDHQMKQSTPSLSVTLFGTVYVAALVVLASEQTSAREGPDLQTLSVTSFGAIPDDGQDDLPAVQAALERASGAGRASVLSFPPGRDDFFKETATKVRYPVTAVHLQWDLVTPFHLNGSKQLTIDSGVENVKTEGWKTARK